MYTNIQGSPRKTVLINQLCIVEWCLVIVYFIVQPLLHNAGITRMVWIPALMVMFAVNILQYMDVYKVKAGYFVALFTLFSIILFGAVYYEIFTDYNKVLSVFAFVNMILLIVHIDNIDLTSRTMNTIYWCNVILAILFLIYTQTPIVHKVTSESGVRYIKYFVFNLDNSNTAGVYLYSIFCVILTGFPNRRHKFVYVLLLIGVFWMIIMTGARTCIVAVMFVFIISLIRSGKIPNWIAAGSMLFPIFFVPFYLGLYYSGFENFTLGSPDKSFFSGRQETFVEYLSTIDTFPKRLFGNMGEYTFTNAHNSALAVYCSVGLIGLLCVWYILMKKVLSLNLRDKPRSCMIAVACILGVFLQTSGEASFLLGGFPSIPFLFTFFLIASSGYCEETEGSRRE